MHCTRQRPARVQWPRSRRALQSDRPKLPRRGRSLTAQHRRPMRAAPRRRRRPDRANTCTYMYDAMRSRERAILTAPLACTRRTIRVLYTVPSDRGWFGIVWQSHCKGFFAADRNRSAIPPPQGTVWPWQRVRPSPALGTQPTSAPAAAYAVAHQGVLGDGPAGRPRSWSCRGLSRMGRDAVREQLLGCGAAIATPRRPPRQIYVRSVAQTCPTASKPLQRCAAEKVLHRRPSDHSAGTAHCGVCRGCLGCRCKVHPGG
eukprot:COSAG01_NODE_2537_length_7450_cov_5.509411_9_plen_258_part_01